jgi:hypothetical protein
MNTISRAPSTSQDWPCLPHGWHSARPMAKTEAQSALVAPTPTEYDS